MTEASLYLSYRRFLTCSLLLLLFLYSASASTASLSIHVDAPHSLTEKPLLSLTASTPSGSSTQLASPAATADASSSLASSSTASHMADGSVMNSTLDSPTDMHDNGMEDMGAHAGCSPVHFPVTLFATAPNGTNGQSCCSYKTLTMRQTIQSISLVFAFVRPLKSVCLGVYVDVPVYLCLVSAVMVSTVSQ